jgi:hypothetical protein
LGLEPAKNGGAIMNISDIRTKIDAQNERSRLVTRGADRSIEPDETVLTLVDHAERNEPESSIMTDPLIQALVDKLPPPNSIWSIDDRAKWLKALAMIFNLVYRTEKGEATEQKIEKTTESTLPVLSAVS